MKDMIKYGAVILGFIALNVICSQWRLRIDLTSTGLYTIDQQYDDATGEAQVTVEYLVEMSE